MNLGVEGKKYDNLYDQVADGEKSFESDSRQNSRFFEKTTP